jgi:hypothetical protein
MSPPSKSKPPKTPTSKAQAENWRKRGFDVPDTPDLPERTSAPRTNPDKPASTSRLPKGPGSVYDRAARAKLY